MEVGGVRAPFNAEKQAAYLRHLLRKGVTRSLAQLLSAQLDLRCFSRLYFWRITIIYCAEATDYTLCMLWPSRVLALSGSRDRVAPLSLFLSVLQGCRMSSLDSTVIAALSLTFVSRAWYCALSISLSPPLLSHSHSHSRCQSPSLSHSSLAPHTHSLSCTRANKYVHTRTLTRITPLPPAPCVWCVQS